MADVSLETCANCGRVIGEPETPMVWKEQVVCGECRRNLSETGDAGGGGSACDSAWPGAGGSEADWLLASGQFARRIPDPGRSISRLLWALQLLRVRGFAARSQPLMLDAIEFAPAVRLATQRRSIWLEAAAQSVEVGAEDIAAGHILRAKECRSFDIRGKPSSDRPVVVFATYLGLLGSLRGLTPREERHARLRAVLFRADREARLGRINSCRTDLLDAIELLPAADGGWEGRDCKKMLMRFLAEIGEAESVKIVYRRVPKDPWYLWDVVGPLWKIGERDEYRAWIDRQLAESEELSRKQHGRYGGLAQIESVAITQADLGDTDGLVLTLGRMRSLFVPRGIADDDRLMAAALTAMARIQARGGFLDEARTTLVSAMAAADLVERGGSCTLPTDQAGSGETGKCSPAVPNRTVMWEKLSEAFLACGEWEAASLCASHVESTTNRQALLATGQVGTGDWEGLQTNLLSIATPDAAVDAARLVAERLVRCGIGQARTGRELAKSKQ